jgi:hypothetical protein
MKGARLISPISDAEKLYGGSSMYVLRAVVMTVLKARRMAYVRELKATPGIETRIMKGW